LTVGVTKRLNEAFRWLKTGKFSEIASVKIRRQAKTMEGKSNYHPCSTWNFEATGAAGENLQPFSFGRLDRLLRPRTQPWEVFKEREQTGFS